MNHFTRIVTAGAFALAAFATGATAQAKDIKIGVANLSLCCAYFVGMDLAIKDEAKVYPNVTVVSTDAKGDVAKLTSNVEDLISQKVDGIIVSGAWDRSRARSARRDQEGWHSQRRSRSSAEGRRGDQLGRAGQFGDRHPASASTSPSASTARAWWSCCVAALPITRSALDRTNGMLSVVEKAGIKIAKAPDFGGWSVDGGFKLMEDMLTKNPEDRRRILRERLDVPGCAEGRKGRQARRRDVLRLGRWREGHAEGDHARRHQLRRQPARTTPIRLVGRRSTA